jgi:hypothetical protein
MTVGKNEVRGSTFALEVTTIILLSDFFEFIVAVSSYGPAMSSYEWLWVAICDTIKGRVSMSAMVL